jgi:hypothetical protein
MAPPPPTVPSIKVRKHFTYRLNLKEFTNRYFVSPSIPASSADWTALSDAVVAGEKAIYPSYVTIDEVIAYDAGSEVPVWSKTYSAAGTLVYTSTEPTPGDAAMLVRYSTTQRTSKNHPIYLFNYYHGVRWDAAGDNDTVCAAQVAALGVYAGNWVSGGWVSGKTYKKTGPYGAVAQGEFVEPFITHRDFRR